MLHLKSRVPQRKMEDLRALTWDPAQPSKYKQIIKKTNKRLRMALQSLAVWSQLTLSMSFPAPVPGWTVYSSLSRGHTRVYCRRSLLTLSLLLRSLSSPLVKIPHVPCGFSSGMASLISLLSASWHHFRSLSSYIYILLPTRLTYHLGRGAGSFLSFTFYFSPVELRYNWHTACMSLRYKT